MMFKYSYVAMALAQVAMAQPGADEGQSVALRARNLARDLTLNEGFCMDTLSFRQDFKPLHRKGAADMVCIFEGPGFGNGHGISVKKNNGKGEMNGGIVHDYRQNDWCKKGKIYLEDINNDGFTDLVCFTQDKKLLLYATHFAGLGYGSTKPINIDPTGFCKAPEDTIVFGDVDGDGIKDTICWYNINTNSDGTTKKSEMNVLASSKGWKLLHKQEEFASKCRKQELSPLGGVITQYVEFRDMNGDGKDDLICAHSDDSSHLQYFISKGDGSFGERVNVNGYADTKVDYAIGDVSGNGLPDVLEHTPATGKMVFKLNGGNNKFSEHDVSSFCKGGEVGLEDLNDDGRADIFCKNTSIKKITGKLDLNIQAPKSSAAFAAGVGVASVAALGAAGLGTMKLKKRRRENAEEKAIAASLASVEEK